MHMISLQAEKTYYWTKRKINQVKWLCVMLVTINNQNEIIFFFKSINIYYEIGSNSKHTARHYFLNIKKDLLIFLSGCVNENIRKSLCKTYIDILKTESLWICLILNLDMITFLTFMKEISIQCLWKNYSKNNKLTRC